MADSPHEFSRIDADRDVARVRYLCLAHPLACRSSLGRRAGDGLIKFGRRGDGWGAPVSSWTSTPSLPRGERACRFNARASPKIAPLWRSSVPLSPLIGFGFTIYQFFQRLREQDVITGAAAPRHFGFALVALGVLMLFFGIAYHVRFMLGLRRLRESMREEELIHGETVFPVSLTLITAFLLLAIGIAAIVSMEFRVGPFG